MRTNKYADADLQRRSDLATSLKYGAKATAAPTPQGTYAENIPFPAGLTPSPKPITLPPKPDDVLPQADVIAMMDTTAESTAMADVLTPGLGLACSELTSPPQWACVRNASDPCINGKLDAAQQESCAEYYYTKFGYWTTVMSALTTWAIIAGL